MAVHLLTDARWQMAAVEATQPAHRWILTSAHALAIRAMSVETATTVTVYCRYQQAPHRLVSVRV